MSGFNTDAYGFLASLRDVRTDWKSSAGPIVVLGAGGAARAVVVALLDDGAQEIRLLNRTRERAQELARIEPSKVKVEDWDRRGAVLEGAALLVNTTSQGMVGYPPLDVSLDALPKAAAVCDIVYNPLETPLLAAATEARQYRDRRARHAAASGGAGLRGVLWSAPAGLERIAARGGGDASVPCFSLSALFHERIALFRQPFQLFGLLRDPVGGKRLVGSAGLGGGLFDQLTDILPDDGHAPIDLGERN